MPVEGKEYHMLLHRGNGQFYYPDDTNIYKNHYQHVYAKFMGSGKGFEFVRDYDGKIQHEGDLDWNTLEKDALILEAKRKHPELKLDRRETIIKLRSRVIEYEQQLYEEKFVEGEVEPPPSGRVEVK